MRYATPWIALLLVVVRDNLDEVDFLLVVVRDNLDVVDFTLVVVHPFGPFGVPYMPDIVGPRRLICYLISPLGG